MDEWESSVLNQQLAALEKAMAHAYRADRLRYAELFKLHKRVQRQAERVDADSGLIRAGPANGVVRERLGSCKTQAVSGRYDPGPASLEMLLGRRTLSSCSTL